MTPTVGRIVHIPRFVDLASAAYGLNVGGSLAWAAPAAAIISAVSPELDGVVDLHVFRPDGVVVVRGVGYSEEPKEGCWSWPPKVEAPAPVVPPAE